MIGQIGAGGDTLNRLQEIVESERQRAAGRARVARDSMNMSEVELKEAEQKALANQALADFAAQAGISVQSGNEPAPAPRRVLAPITIQSSVVQS